MALREYSLARPVVVIARLLLVIFVVPFVAISSDSAAHMRGRIQKGRRSETKEVLTIDLLLLGVKVRGSLKKEDSTYEALVGLCHKPRKTTEGVNHGN